MNKSHTKKSAPRQLIFEYLLHILLGAVGFLVLALFVFGVHYLRVHAFSALRYTEFDTTFFSVEVSIVVIDSLIFGTFIWVATLRFLVSSFFISKQNSAPQEGVE